MSAEGVSRKARGQEWSKMGMARAGNNDVDTQLAAVTEGRRVYKSRVSEAIGIKNYRRIYVDTLACFSCLPLPFSRTP